MFKVSTAIVALLLAGLMGLACSNSGLRSNAHDGEAASGGQAGSTISNGTTEGTGGTIGPGGAGGASIGGTGETTGFGGRSGTAGTAGSSGIGGQTGSYPTCALIRMCDPTDQQVGGTCPPARECYSFQQECFDATTVCMLPAGVHCSDLSCNPGDTETTGDDQDCWQNPNPCYTRQLCAHEIWCRYGADAGVSDAGLDTDAPSVGVDGRTMRTCGNGVLDPGEQCDDGNTKDGDGCSATCQFECQPIPGQTCIGLPRCGNGVLTSNEACDDGNTASGDGCSEDCQTIEPGWLCRVPGKPCTRICGSQLDGSLGCDGGSDQGDQCGDGVVETGKECDCGDGTIPVPAGCPGPNNDNTYGGCTTRCTWGPFCGDGTVNGPEQCDLGKLNGSDLGPNGCTFGCMRFRNCGDGIVETGEECDCGDGTVPVSASCPGPNGEITYGGCKTDCTRGPHCGDGILDPREECDCGPPDPVSGQPPCSYCAPDCKLLNM